MNNATFLDLNLTEPILQALATEGFVTPTPVQAQAIPHALNGHDLLASAQTGSGKTAAFALPILHRLAQKHRRAEPGRPKALVLAPTRELAGQIGEVFRLLGRNLEVSTAVIYGGVGKANQIKAMRRGTDVVVATPGRLLDLMGEGVVVLDRISTVVLDEADRMLDMGFIPAIERIIKRLPFQRQSLFFSATLPPAVVRLANEMLVDPIRIDVESNRQNTPRIDQRVMFVERERKRDALRSILADRGSFRALVFTRTKYGARNLARYLVKNGVASDDLHGDKSQHARTQALRDFHSGKVHVLVATDIASRGIDIDDIDHVINFDLPTEAESYVHRIGRTARAGRAGSALTLCDSSELEKLFAIQKALNTQIPVLAEHPYHVAELALNAARKRRSSTGNPPHGARRYPAPRNPARGRRRG